MGVPSDKTGIGWRRPLVDQSISFGSAITVRDGSRHLQNGVLDARSNEMQEQCSKGEFMKLSVILPCLNEEQFLGNQLEALASQLWGEPWEVIVADNGSTDRSLDIVEKYKGRLPNLRLVDASDRRGQAHALNVGARAATAAVLAFCDADDEVAPGWVAAMGKALTEYDFVACRFETEKLNPPWIRDQHRSPQQDGVQKFTYPPYLPHAGSGSIGIKRTLHQAAGGFDESLPVLFDTDYCFKIQLAGTKLYFVPDAVIHLRYRDTFTGIYRQARTWGEYNVFIHKKYRPLDTPGLSWKHGISGWVPLMRRLPRIRSKANVAAWVWQFGWRLGILQGCIKYRHLAF
jgi:glycosyltransferase involved in cell wall biosynthesis